MVDVPVVGPRRNILYLAHRQQTVDDAPENGVLAVEEVRRSCRDEELASVRVRPRVRLRISTSPLCFPRERTYHGEQSGRVVLDFEVLIIELAAVNGKRARSIVSDEIPALAHKLGDTVDRKPHPAGLELHTHTLLSARINPRAYR